MSLFAPAAPAPSGAWHTVAGQEMLDEGADAPARRLSAFHATLGRGAAGVVVHVMQGRDPGTGPGEKTGSSVEARVTTPLTSGSL